MKTAICTLALAATASAGTPPKHYELEGYTFERYLEDFGKSYTGAAEMQAHRLRFTKQLAAVRAHNSDNSSSYKMGINQFTDMSESEFARFKGGARARGAPLPSELPHEQHEALVAAMNQESFPASVDWRTKGVCTPVKNQGGCGSCWAFSGTEVLESHVAIKTGKLIEMSPQEFVSCTPNPKACGGTGGCQGATQWLLFDYAVKAGITTEADYPYTAKTGTCNTAAIKPVAGITGTVRLPTNNYTAIMGALQLGPVAISVSAGWRAYESGVFDDVEGCGFNIDHGVVAVGYGSDASIYKDYFIVRNSWGENWGESGYIRLMRDGEGTKGVDTRPADGTLCKPYPATQNVTGICGMLSDSSYAVGGHLTSNN